VFEEYSRTRVDLCKVLCANERVGGSVSVCRCVCVCVCVAGRAASRLISP